MTKMTKVLNDFDENYRKSLSAMAWCIAGSKYPTKMTKIIKNNNFERNKKKGNGMKDGRVHMTKGTILTKITNSRS